MKWLTVCPILLLCNTPLAAGDLTSLYNEATLQYWKGRYERSTIKTRDEFIWNKWLFVEEKRKFGKPPILEFPLWTEGEAKNNPLTFYASVKRGTIVLPVFSLKFLDDLCTAYAWLQVKGYRLETISEYTAMLSYRSDAPPGGYRPPLEALHIPADALMDAKVNELSLGHFVTARTFILLHEMGHIFYGHSARTYSESVRNEQEADRFAATVMQRPELPPLGILVYFMAEAHFSDYPAREITHPLSGKRLIALADHFGNRDLAEQLRKLGKLLDDPEIRAGFVATGLAGRLEDLAPRREVLPSGRIRLKPGDRTSLFHGVYHGEIVRSTEPKPLAVRLGLQRQGDRVYGHYTFGLGSGFLYGEVKGKDLHFDWKWAGNSGHGVLNGRDDGSFTGTWGYRNASSGAGTWTGRRDP
jgi:hypothetical protein